MLRKALTLGMVVIFALSLLAVSMITCFTYEAEAHLIDRFGIVNQIAGHGHYRCKNGAKKITGLNAPLPLRGWTCTWYTQ